MSRCIDSILSQTFVYFEILLIDDGSSDTSGVICDQYAERDLRIHVIHKQKGGASSARNIGLNNANGTWVAFVDSDDWIKKTYLEELYNGIKESDFVISGYQQFGGFNNIIKYKEHIYDFQKKDDIWRVEGNAFLIKCIFYHPWRKLFKLDMIREHSIFFDETIFLSEDTLFIMKYLCFCEKIRILPNVSYMYYLPLTNNAEKYLMNLYDLNSHINAFEFNARLLSNAKKNDFQVLKQLMFDTYFAKFLMYCLSKGILFYRKQINEYKKYCKEKKESPHLFTLKKLRNSFIVKYPILGFIMLKMILLIKEWKNKTLIHAWTAKQ